MTHETKEQRTTERRRLNTHEHGREREGGEGKIQTEKKGGGESSAQSDGAGRATKREGEGRTRRDPAACDGCALRQ